MKIAIASGKGGTGKTTVATALAEIIENSIYIDMDVEEPNGHIFLKPENIKQEIYEELIPQIDPNICTYCGKCADACIYSALSIVKSIKKIMFFKELCHSCGVCAYVCPVEGALKEVPTRKGVINFGYSEKIGKHSSNKNNFNSNNNEPSNNKSISDNNKKQNFNENINFIEGILDLGQPSAVPLISGINKIIDNKYSNFKDKMLILDAPPGTSCPVVATLERADFIILVTEPTPFGLNDLDLALSLIKDLNKPYALVINKYDKENDIAIEFAKEKNIKIIAKIPFDLKVAKSYSKGNSILEVSAEIKEEFINIYDYIKKTFNIKN